MTRSTFVVNGHASTDATFPRVTTCDAQSTSDTAQPQLDEPHKPRCNIQLLLGITRVLLGVLCVFMEILIAVLYSAAAGYQGFWAGPFVSSRQNFNMVNKVTESQDKALVSCKQNILITHIALLVSDKFRNLVFSINFNVFPWAFTATGVARSRNKPLIFLLIILPP